MIQPIYCFTIFASSNKNIYNMKTIQFFLIMLTTILVMSSCKMSGFTSVDSVATGVVCDSIKIHHHYSTNK